MAAWRHHFFGEAKTHDPTSEMVRLSFSPDNRAKPWQSMAFRAQQKIRNVRHGGFTDSIYVAKYKKRPMTGCWDTNGYNTTQDNRG
jgi:hypothetical protein